MQLLFTVEKNHLTKLVMPQKTEYENKVQERLDVIYKKWKDNPSWDMHEFLSNLMPHSRMLVRVSNMNLVLLSEGLHFWNAKGYFAYAVPTEYFVLFNFGKDLKLWSFQTSVSKIDGLFKDILAMKEFGGFKESKKLIEILEKAILIFKNIPNKAEKPDEYIKYLDSVAVLEDQYFELMINEQRTETLMFEALWKAYQYIENVLKTGNETKKNKVKKN